MSLWSNLTERNLHCHCITGKYNRGQILANNKVLNNSPITLNILLLHPKYGQLYIAILPVSLILIFSALCMNVHVYLFCFCCCLVTRSLSDSFATPNPPGSSAHWISQARILEWVSFPSGIFPTQGSNPHLLHWQVDSLPLSHQYNPSVY